MAYFFQKNRQRLAQWNPTRRAAPWGRGPIPQIVLHTFEWPANRSVLSAATYLLNRTTHGSYHSLAGGTSQRDILRLAPVTAETWHCVPSNNWASGVSATTYAANWNKLSATQRRNFVHSMAYASYLLSQELIAIGKSPVPAKRISRAQAMRGVWGFTYHRTMDPGRRTDPAHPEHNFPWDMFLTEYNRLMGSTSAPSPAPGKDWLTMPSNADLEKIAFAVWSYRNDKLEESDAYTLLRRIRDRAEETRDLTRDIHRGENRIALSGSTANMFGESWRAGSLLGYAAGGGFQTEDRLIEALAEELDTNTETILAAISRVLNQGADDSDPTKNTTEGA